MNDIQSKDVWIEIRGTQSADGERDIVEFATTGQFYKEKGHFFLVYEESELTGFAGTTTTLDINPDVMVIMSRDGDYSSQLMVEKGKRHSCSYGSEFGYMTIGIWGKTIETKLNETGGTVSFSYTMDIESELASENRVDLKVTARA